MHIAEAARPDELDTTIADLRWVAARLLRAGPIAPGLDLARGSTTRAVSLGRALSRAAHLLTPATPPRAVADVLASRLCDDPDWHDEIVQWQGTLPIPRLANRWALPDLPDHAVRRILTGHTGRVWSVAIAADGTWLATAGNDGTVRICDPATGAWVASMRVDGIVHGVAWTPDGGGDALAGSRGVYLFDYVRSDNARHLT